MKKLLLIYIFSIFLMPLFLVGEGIEDAQTYHGNSTMQWRVAMEAINALSWEGNEHVLDIGCGDGKITALLAEKLHLGSILGMDISSSMVEFATLNYPKEHYPNLAFQQLDATEIPFKNHFDRVVSFSALHWVVNQEKALAGIYNCLVPGGFFCIQTYGTGIMNVTVIGDALIHTDKWKEYFPSYVKQRVFFTAEAYQTLLEEAGFRNIVVKGSWYETFFKNRKELLNFAKPLLNFILHLPLELQEAFVEDVVNEIMAVAHTLEDGTICYKTFNLQASGNK